MRVLLVAAVVMVGCSGGGGGTGGGAGGGTSATGGGSTGGGTGGATGGGTAGGTGGSTGGGVGGGATGGGSGGSGGSGGGTPVDAGSIALGNLCTGYVDALCDYYTRCGYTETKAGCITLTTQKFNPYFASTCFLDETHAVSAGRATYDDRAAAACLYQLRTLGCGQNGTTYAPDCQHFLVGRVTDGGCAQSFECDTNSYCDSSLAMCPGRCSPRKLAGADAGYDGECQSGYYVYDGVCRAYTLTGLSCAPTRAGLPTQQCRPGDAQCVGNICRAPSGDGGMCMADSDCAFPLRCSGMVCSPASGLGQVCGYGFLGPAQSCKLDLGCANPFRGDGGTCVNPSGPGASCVTVLDCTGSLQCPGFAVAYSVDAGAFTIDAGRCTAGLDAGTVCDPAAPQCAGTAFCLSDAGTPRCTERRDLGTLTHCTYDGECTPPEACVGGTCRRPACALP